MFSLFSKDSLFNVKQVNNQPKLYYTNYIYNNYTWYHLRYKFNCDEGKYGNYEVWIKKEDEDEKYLGKYDYRNGPLNGIHTFALSLGDQQLLRTKQVIIDNIIFKFKR